MSDRQRERILGWGAQAPPPDQVVGEAIQRLAAARLGRAFLLLGLLLIVGLGEMLGGRVPGLHPFLLAVGAPASAGAMLAHGLGVVQRAFGRRHRAWWALAGVGNLMPLAFGVYVLGWQGLRLIARWNGVVGVLTGAFFTVLGFAILRSWQRLSELETLATVMSLGGPEVRQVGRQPAQEARDVHQDGEEDA